VYCTTVPQKKVCGGGDLLLSVLHRDPFLKAIINRIESKSTDRQFDEEDEERRNHH
jgi:hypothetical protein